MNRDPLLDTLADAMSDLAKMVVGAGAFVIIALVIVGLA